MTDNHGDILPFRIEVEQAEIDRLHRHLDETRWPPVLPGDGWDTGVPVAWLRELTEYWRNDYDWRAAEHELNQVPQFTTIIGLRTPHCASGWAWT